MKASKKPSPARSQGQAKTPRREMTRRTRSVGSPATSNASGRLTSVLEGSMNRNDSFSLVLAGRKSILTDNTDIAGEPRRTSWWKKLGENSQDVMEILEDNVVNANVVEPNHVLEELDIEVLSQENQKKNYTMDLPESSDGESINSIVLPQRKLFTQKENQPQQKFREIMGSRDTLTKVSKNTTVTDKTINAGTKELFQKKQRSKPIFPAALLNITPDKTLSDKTKEGVPAEPKGQVRNLFGNRPGTKRKNMFANFIVSESEDEIPDIQPKVFSFPKKSLPQRRTSSLSRGLRESSPASVTTDIEMDDWVHLPSSTLVENQLEAMLEDVNSPVKRPRLSKLSETKESEASNKSKGNKSSSKNTTLTRSKAKVISEENELEHTLTQNKSQDKSINKSKVNESKNKSGLINKSKASTDEEKAKERIRTQNKSLDKSINKSKDSKSNKKSELKNNSKTDINESGTNKTSTKQMNQSSKSTAKQTIPSKNKTMVIDKEKDVTLKDTTQTGDKNDIEQNEEANANQLYEEVADQIQEEQEASDNEVKQSEDIMDQRQENAEEAETGESHKIDQSKLDNSANEVDQSQQEQDANDKDQAQEQQNASDNEANPSIEVMDQNQDNADEDEAEESHGIDQSQKEEDANENDQSQEEQDATDNEPNQNIEDMDQSQDNADADEAEESHGIDQSKKEEDANENDQSQEEQDASDNEPNQNIEDMDQSQDNADADEADESREIDQNQEEEDSNDNDQSQEEQDASDNEPNQSIVMDQSQENADEDEADESHEVDQSQQEEDASEVEQSQEIAEESQEIEDESEEEEQSDNDAQNESQEHESEQSDNGANLHYDSEEIEDDNEDNTSNKTHKNTNQSTYKNEEIENCANISHDTTGRNRVKDQSPDIARHESPKQNISFSTRGRNTSIRKKTSNFNPKSSVAPARDSIGFSDGTTNSSAEGSGWDSHRTTRKTIRQTFGRDITMRKSLRTLVMEKSAQRQTLANKGVASETLKFPLANSTELPEISHNMDNDDQESNHELSLRTRQTTLEAFLQKIKMDCLERRTKLEEAVRNSIKTRAANQFKVPAKPLFPRRPLKTINKVKNQPILKDIPEELIEDMQYKPPKRFRPRNAPWITNRLYKFLETKLEPKYDYMARVRSEKLVEKIYQFTKELRRQKVATTESIDVLKHEMARLHIVKTHFEFYEFFHQFMPREVRVKVNPDVVNKLPLPRRGVFADIIVAKPSQG